MRTIPHVRKLRSFENGRRAGQNESRKGGARILRLTAEVKMPDQSKIMLADTVLPKTKIDRRSMLDEFERLATPAVVLVEGPAGWGKTSLVMQMCNRWEAQGETAVLLRLREPQREVFAFAKSLLTALKGARLTSLPPLPKSEITADCLHSFATNLSIALRRHSRRVLLVLDDYQRCEADLTDRLLQHLVEMLAENVTLVVASRRSVRFPLSRILLEGRLLRFDRRALAFSKEESRAYFEHSISPSELQQVLAISDGWPAAFVFMQEALKHCRSAERELGLATLPEFARIMSDYCRTEVFEGLSAGENDFLIETAILQTLEPGLCDRVRGGDNSSSLLGRLATRYLLLDVTSIGPNEWRLPELLRQQCLRSLYDHGGKRVALAYERAAGWYEDCGKLREAIQNYVLAGRPDAAVAALEQVHLLNLAVVHGDEYADDLLRQLPARTDIESPGVAICRAYLNFKRGLLEEAELLFEGVRERTNQFTVLPQSSNRSQFELSTLVLETIFAVYRRSSVTLEYLRSIEQRLSGNSKTNNHLLTFVHITLGLLYELRGDLEVASGHLIQADQLMSIAPSRWQALWSFHNHGTIALARGQHMEAQHLFQTGLKRWRAEFKAYRPFGDLVSLLLAEIDYERGAFGEAQAKVDEALYTAEHIEGWFQHYASAYETGMMLSLRLSGRHQAEALLARARSGRRCHGGLHRFIEVLRLRLALLLDETGNAEMIVFQNHLSESWAAENCHDEFSWREWDLLGVCLCQLALQKLDYANAARLAEQLEQIARLSGRTRTLVRALILKSHVNFCMGLQSEAIAEMVSALEFSHSHRFWQTIVDEERLAKPVLLEMVGAEEKTIGRHVKALALQLLGAMEPKPNGCGRVDAHLLSVRESEVVRELTLGYSNKMIARKLALSEATVKFHLSNIFRKLHVRKRSAVVAEAQRRRWVE